MASIRKRGEYQWAASARRRGYPTVCKTFGLKAEAEAWVATIESEMAVAPSSIAARRSARP